LNNPGAVPIRALQDGSVSLKEVKLAVPQSKKNHLSFPTGIVYKINLIHKSHDARAVVIAWSQPGYHGVCSIIYFFHYINLVVPLKNITLIDADCVDPDHLRLCWVSEVLQSM
jgi:hypothetical protein